jgi:hypothetical protein
MNFTYYLLFISSLLNLYYIFEMSERIAFKYVIPETDNDYLPFIRQNGSMPVNPYFNYNYHGKHKQKHQPQLRPMQMNHDNNIA